MLTRSGVANIVWRLEVSLCGEFDAAMSLPLLLRDRCHIVTISGNSFGES
jgi:hypothetical protein